MRTLLLILLSAASVIVAVAQSGRRVNTARPPTPTAPIQAPLNPEPEPPPSSTRVGPGELTFLPETLMARQIKAIDSGTFRLGDFRGKVVVINIWASWCGPCRMEVPEYEKVRKEYAGRPVEFIGLTTEDPRTAADKVNQFLRTVNFGFRLGWADRESARTLMNGRNAIPQTLVIGTDSTVVRHWTGYARGQSASRLKETIEHALSSAP